MKAKLLIITAAALLATLSLQLPAAPLGTAFTYQGKLTAGGQPASGSYDLMFTLHGDASVSNVVAAPIISSAVGVTNGLFTVTLDFGAGAFNGDARWLEILVGTNGGAFTMLAPRQPLTPAPYALYAPSAGNAALLNGQSPAAYAPASGSTAYVAKDGDTMTGTLTLPANGLRAGTSQLVLSGGNVGIGTATPAAQLDVAGTVKATALNVGQNHTLTGDLATIAGGYQNTISNAAWSVDSIGGGQENRITSAGSATIAGGYQNTISNGAWAAAIGGGQSNRIASATHAAIGGGQQNTIADGAWGATVPGGAGNSIQANSVLATIAGGNANTIQANSGFAAIGGGSQNTLGPDSLAAVVSGGEGNRASASHAVIGGGYFNSNTAWAGTIPGGRSNVVTGALGFAAGNRAKANHQGSFVWGDSTDADVASTANNQFLIRASGGVRVEGGPIKATGGLIIETRTSDPPSPAVGQIWLRTDL